MTEYDYSPDEVKQYLATQKRVSNWVDHTKLHPPCNPFAPSSPITPDSPDSKTHISTSKSRTSSDRPFHPRSQAPLSPPPPIPGHYSLHSSSARSPPSQHTQSSARYTESTYLARHTATQSSPTVTSRHTHKPNKPRIYYQTVDAYKDRPTTISRSDETGYIIRLNEGRSGVIFLPPPGKRMEVWTGQEAQDQSMVVTSKKSKRSKDKKKA
ncbi:hypothetical protein Agabi119p4_6748 [Agaricus bisporus var. burnettii]|uniref:Uncharacterized protein n=1 Tax=Agaricus bisporus var. burnettii TaxID=192524 RepID=A0A8H7C988_AGABI|nr:hypothetical protein Agabi119p4_6748 [Agaricus bisporus var. burnettii]